MFYKTQLFLRINPIITLHLLETRTVPIQSLEKATYYNFFWYWL